VLIKSCTGEVV